MTRESDIKKELQKDIRVKKELQKLNKIFRNIPKNQKTLVNGLIENAAFMGVLLDDLKVDIKENGYKETYQNGANQKGVKRSVAADLYQVTIKNYSSVIKLLSELKPGDDEEDELMDFLNRRQDM